MRPVTRTCCRVPTLGNDDGVQTESWEELSPWLVIICCAAKMSTCRPNQGSKSMSHRLDDQAVLNPLI